MSAVRQGSRGPLLGLVVGVLVIGIVAARWLSAPPPKPFVPSVAPVVTAPMCPWREPEADLRAFFPGAVRYETEARILSAKRAELAGRLGRTPDAEENSLYLYRVFDSKQPRGTVLIRRVRAEHGAIEVVAGVRRDGTLQGLRLQSLREPPIVERALTSSRWLAAFRGKSADSDWSLGAGLPTVPAAAKPSAEAIADGVRSLLIQYEIAERSGLKRSGP